MQLLKPKSSWLPRAFCMTALLAVILGSKLSFSIPPDDSQIARYQNWLSVFQLLLSDKQSTRPTDPVSPEDVLAGLELLYGKRWVEDRTQTDSVINEAEEVFSIIDPQYSRSSR